MLKFRLRSCVAAFLCFIGPFASCVSAENAEKTLVARASADVPFDDADYDENSESAAQSVQADAATEASVQSAQEDAAHGSDGANALDAADYENVAMADLPREDEIANVNKILNAKLSVVSAPRQTQKNRAFSAPFRVNAKDDAGNPLANFEISVSYPLSRDGDEIVYDVRTVTTDENGVANFMPDAPKFSFDDVISFYPADAQTETAIATSPYRVRTNLLSRGGMVYVWDFNESGRALTNSRYLLRELINAGASPLGNSPLSSASYLNQGAESLYRATKNIVGNAYAFLVAGSMKFAEPVTRGDDGLYSCALVADITCIDMQNGNVLYHTNLRETQTGSTSQEAIDSCRRELSKTCAHAIVYGM